MNIKIKLQSKDKLSTHTKNGVTTTYTYDMLGLRRSKSNNGVTTRFIYDGDKLIGLVHPSYSIYFLYHGDDLYGFLYEGDVYYYERNILGEILGIVDSSGSVISTYSYTAYGEITFVSGSSLGLLNPMRYKGYFYDGESGYYYCKSRYYVPNIGRWLTPDKVKYLDNSVICGYNPFIYCKNNPIMYVDEDGNFAVSSLIVGAIIGAAIGFGVAAYCDYNDDGHVFNGSVNWQIYVGATLVGGALGSLGGVVGSSITGTIITFGEGTALSGSGVLTVTSGISISGSQLLIGSGLLGILVMAAQWKQGSWPGDDSTVSPGDGFEWRGQKPVGGDKGAWFNPMTGDSLHPDLNHPQPIGPHWDWINKILEILTQFISRWFDGI